MERLPHGFFARVDPRAGVGHCRGFPPSGAAAVLTAASARPLIVAELVGRPCSAGADGPSGNARRNPILSAAVLRRAALAEGTAAARAFRSGDPDGPVVPAGAPEPEVAALWLRRGPGTRLGIVQRGKGAGRRGKVPTSAERSSLSFPPAPYRR